MPGASSAAVGTIPASIHRRSVAMLQAKAARRERAAAQAQYDNVFQDVPVGIRRPVAATPQGPPGSAAAEPRLSRSPRSTTSKSTWQYRRDSAAMAGPTTGSFVASSCKPASPTFELSLHPLSEVRRSAEQKASSPERLNVDNQQLTLCPRLCGEERLRLLNYQSNLIRDIENLDGLPNLIFLDLYNNKIAKISNLDCVPGLRVLMLGKNRLRRIEALEALSRIDVLDLHSNQITEIQGLAHLKALRVLNLAGNNINCLKDVHSESTTHTISLRVASFK